MKTEFLKKEEIQKNWLLIDAHDAILGRLAVLSANILRGKNKVDYTPNQDCGDYLIIINSDKVKITGKKIKNQDVSLWVGRPPNPEATVYAVTGRGSALPGRRASSRRSPRKKFGASCCRVLSNAGQALRTARQKSLGENAGRAPGAAGAAPRALCITRSSSWVRRRISVAWGWVSSATLRPAPSQALVAWPTAFM